MKLTFKISLLSDYHIGAGHGRGIVDSVLLKDEQGFPTIRGTTLSGLLRQGMWDLLQLELLAQYHKCKQSGNISGISYCSGGDAESMCPICQISGTPAHQKKWRISSAEMEDLAIKSEKIVWRNKVNPRTRTAEARKLFNEEMVGKGTNFIFTVSNETNDEQVSEEASFIVAAFRMVRNLGSSRRRGKGRCQIHLINVTNTTSDLEHLRDVSLEDYFLDLFKSVWLENNRQGIPISVTQSKTIMESSLTKKAFNIILLTEEPLLIANKSESGNIYNTNRCIPGYTLLGALAWRIADRCDLDDKDVYGKFIKLFRRGGVKVSPLYPALKIRNDIYPSIPSPHDFLSCKLYPVIEEFGHGVKGYATDTDEPEKCEKCWSEDKIETPLEALNKYIAMKYRERPKDVEVSVREEMHITIDLDKGKTITGDLFGYVSIDSGEYFIGTIEIADWTNFANLMEIGDESPVFELLIGKASSRGYGRVRVWLQPNTGSENIFLGKGLRERITDLTEHIRMTLLTDAILVDRWGRFLNAPDKSFLKDLLKAEVEVINTYVRSKNVDGFNTHIGLPKWRDVAITAGSTVGFTIKDSNDEEMLKRLEELESEGIGLRKDEGFGRIAFNHPIYSRNEDVDVRIYLPENMRIKRRRENVVEGFEGRWKERLNDRLNPELFTDRRWIAVSRWLRANSMEDIEQIRNGIDNFHTTKNVRDKKKFMEKEGEKGKDALNSVLEWLSETLQMESENMREYLQIESIETLADFIASSIKEER